MTPAKPAKRAAGRGSGRATRRFDLMSAPGHLIRRVQQVHVVVWSASPIPESITSVQFGILVLLDRYPDIDQRTVGEFLSIDTSTLGEVFLRLSERGLVERRRDPADRRRYALRLTPEARRILKQTTPLVEGVGEKLLEPLSPQECETLLRLLRKLLLYHQPGTDSNVVPHDEPAARRRA